ncbi:MAG: nucleotidyltransferase domain-containing protein [Oceanicaulis sp.]|nr:nucleotidyltransferase domain-containing protein [Oceanicaulis sp.]
MRTFAPPVTSFDDIAARLRERTDSLRAFDVDAVTVFGSFACGEFDGASDVDLVVEPGPRSFSRLLDLQDLLESALMRPVDVLTPGALKPRLVGEVARTGQRITL